MLTKALQKIGESLLLFGVADHKGLLRLPDPTGGVALDGRLTAGGLFAGDARFKNVQAHDVAGSVVKNQGEEIEVDNGVQAAGQVVEQCREITLLGNGLADLEQGFELTPGMFQRGGERHFRRGDDGIRHSRQDNTRVGEGSTLTDPPVPKRGPQGRGFRRSPCWSAAFLPERQKRKRLIAARRGFRAGTGKRRGGVRQWP